MDMQALLVAVVIVTAFGMAAVTPPVLAQNTTGGKNMTMTMNGNMTSMGGNMTQPLEDENMTLRG
jgi:hypothetical protein